MLGSGTKELLVVEFCFFGQTNGIAVSFKRMFYVGWFPFMWTPSAEWTR